MRFVLSIIALLAISGNAGARVDATSQTIPYERLSDESVTRFPVENYPSKFRSAYAQAAKKYPNVRDCLVNAEASKVDPDIRQFDWDKLDSAEVAAVCFFRVVTSLNDVAKLRRWFEFHGFGTFVSYDQQASRVPIYFAAGYGVRTKGRPPKFPTSGLRAWLSTYFTAGQDVVITMNADGSVVEISCNYTSW